MGSRAIVYFECDGEISPGVYLQWNGRPECVYAFLAEMERRRCRIAGYPEEAAARFCHVVCDFFDEDEAGWFNVSLVPPLGALTPAELKQASPDDNGVYVICTTPGFRWKMRRYAYGRELSEEEVEVERQEAIEHEECMGANTIAAAFLRQRPKISEL